ncbi:MAG TPA: hypothetical protein VHE12_01265 [bacterium]|nr:hypothetical protein [bacterium]
MKTTLKCFSLLALLAILIPAPAPAGQQVFLSTSPNERYRVYVEQVIDRRIGDQVFFRYPISLVNVRRPERHFFILNVGSPLITETDKQTFRVKWGGADPTQPSSILFDWAEDSLKFFMRVEVLRGTWKTYFVDVNSGKVKDITGDLEKALVAEIGQEDCQEPAVSVAGWTKPYLAFLKLVSFCGKSREHLNDKHFNEEVSVLFDTEKAEVVSHCVNCKDKSAYKKFDKYFIKSIPTPTPTPEETPVAQ